MVCGPAWPGGSAKITGIKVDSKARRVVISAKGPVGKHVARVIGRPNRLFIDFDKTVLGRIDRKINPRGIGVHEIRSGHFKGKARVVLDFRSQPVPGFQVHRNRGNIVIALGKSVDDDTTAPARRKPVHPVGRKDLKSPLAPDYVKASAKPKAKPRGSARKRGPAGKRFAQNMPDNMSLRERAQRNTSAGGAKPSKNSYRANSSPGRGRGGMTKEVKPPVTPPTPDPRLTVQEITELKFTQVGHNSRLIIRGGDKLDYRMTKDSPTKLRIDLINAEIPEVHQKPLTTDKFSTSVEMIVPGSQNIFVQLKDAVPYQVEKKKGVLMVDFPPPRLALTRDQAAGVGDQAGRDEYARRREQSRERMEAVQIMREESIRQANETRERQIRGLDKELSELRKERNEIEARYRVTPDPEVFSKPVTMDFQGLSLRNAFRLLAEQAGLNIILGSGVRGTTTLKLDNVPMGQVIDTILETHGLDRELVGNVLRIDTTENITARRSARRAEQVRLLREVNQKIQNAQERKARLEQEREEAFEELVQAQKAAEAPTDDPTKIETIGATETIQVNGEPITLVLVQIRLSYANADDVRTILRCVFNRQCAGETTPQATTTARDEQQFINYLRSQGFDPATSPGGRARLRTWQRQQRDERRTEAAEQVAEATTAETAMGALRGMGMDARMQQIIANTVMWANATYNTLYIKDLPERIEEMKKLIATLDVPRPEVLIEARIVQASRDWGRGLGVLWGGSNNQVGPIGNNETAFWGLTANQANAGTNSATGATTPGNPIPGSFMINLPAVVQGLGSVPGVGLQFGYLATDYISELDARLQLGEATGKSKVIARPKVQVQDRQSARISNGRQIAYSTVSADGTQTQLVNVELSLEVQPEIYPDGRVMLSIDVNNNGLGGIVNGQQEILTRSASTTLVVKDGETAVIGGILQEEDSSDRQGLTGLMNVPLINFFFTNKTRAMTVDELLVFITPTIVKRPPRAS
jgi:type IV pilus assembly protein PilQ